MQGSRVIVAVILARLLSPHDYGLAAMVLVFSGLAFVFADLALSTALVQRRNLTEADRSTVFWTSAGAGLLLTLLGVAASGPVADFYGEPRVRSLLAVLSLTFAITALATTQMALLMREMNFRSLELRQMAAALAGGVVGVASAAQGHGAWALIAQNLTIAVISSTLVWRFSGWRPKLTYSLASLRDLGGFGANVLGMRFLIYVNRNVDGLLIGRFLGATALGAYAIALAVTLFPFRQIAGPVQEVLYPAFARMQAEPRRMAVVWLNVNRLVGAVAIPSLLGLMAVAPDFVVVVLGEKWSAATPVIQALAWVGLLQSLQRLNMGILDARNRPRTTLWYSVVVVVSGLAAFFVGLPWGIVGIAIAFAVSSTIVEPFYWWLTARALDTSVWEFLRSLAGVAQASAAMLVCVLASRLLLLNEGVSAGPRLAIAIVVGALVFVPICLWRAPEIRAELLRLRRAPPAPESA